MMTILAKNLKRFRQEKRLTQEAAAETLGVSGQAVSRWECGTTLPDATLLPDIARLYCITIDDLFQETSVAYDNYARRLGSVYESTRKVEDFLPAQQEYKKLLRSEEYSAEDLRSCAVLHQYMMEYCRDKAAGLFEKGLEKAIEEDGDVYWRIKRQQISYLCSLGKGQKVVEEFLPLVEKDNGDFQNWICLIHAYCAMGDSENGLFWAEKAEKKFPESALLHLYLGDICQRLKQYNKAFHHWKLARQLEPTWMDSAYSMAACYEELGEYANAYNIWQAIADDLCVRGYDVEAHEPRINALRCQKKLSEF